MSLNIASATVILFLIVYFSIWAALSAHDVNDGCVMGSLTSGSCVCKTGFQGQNGCTRSAGCKCDYTVATALDPSFKVNGTGGLSPLRSAGTVGLIVILAIAICCCCCACCASGASRCGHGESVSKAEPTAESKLWLLVSFVFFSGLFFIIAFAVPEEYYVVEVPSANIATTMLPGLAATPRDDRPAKWESRGIPLELRGIFWTDFDTTVASFWFLPPTEALGTGIKSAAFKAAVGAGELKAFKILAPTFENRVWTWENNFQYKTAVWGGADYIFSLEETSAVENGVVPVQSGSANYAGVLPAYSNIAGFTVPTSIAKFSMQQTATAVNCGTVGTGAGKGGVESTAVCPNGAWRRYTTALGKAVVPYDLVQIIDQYGEPVQPTYDNWVKARNATKGDWARGTSLLGMRLGASLA